MQTRFDTPRRGLRSRCAAAVLAVAASAAVLAACGSSSKPIAAATTGSTISPAVHQAFLDFSRCMRMHGVPDFPDPRPNGGINLAPGSVDPGSPAVKAGFTTCKHELPGGGPPKNVPESVKVKALRFAQCMRRHGVTNFPDPTFSSSGIQESGPANGINTSSPAFQAATKTCSRG